jgi:hypothetical protein
MASNGITFIPNFIRICPAILENVYAMGDDAIASDDVITDDGVTTGDDVISGSQRIMCNGIILLIAEN